MVAGLPSAFAQAAFSKFGTYPVLMRFSTSPGDILNDGLAMLHGREVEITGIDGARLPARSSRGSPLFRSIPDCYQIV